ncbi:alpha dioxygenase isoform X2 [Tasmannia lanceolata]|uniref:alpha dioxygenase isoform X2 n=1 Tax=Tasmannia lanceolata TaxID=3420 RepID=UPI004062DE2E
MTFSFSLSNLVHPQLRLIVAQMTLFDTILFCIIHLVDKMGKWHRLPVFLVLAYLGIRRHLHQRYNLLHVGGKDGDGRDYDPEKFWYRTADGRCNHPQDDLIGSQGTFFGRNMPPTCSDYEVEIKSPDGIADGCPLKSFKFLKSKEVLTTSSQVKTGFLNTRTPWWDGSVLYGNNNEGMIRVRSFKDGKLKISEDGLLQHDNKGIPISGDVRNCWAGFSLLQALFIKEHNSVCDMLKKHYPDFDDEKLYRHARLVTSAVIAKIHTIDWTIELLKTDILIAGMRINWYGVLGKRFKDFFGHFGGHILSGLVGLRQPKDHGVPYSLTEEFVSVYRMHSLLPDTLLLRDTSSTTTTHDECPPILEEVPMREMAGLEGERSLSNIRMEQMMVSMGYQASGAITLWNYPSWMRNLVTHDINGEDRPDPVDMAALEIYRDRERRVARYNEFRRNLLMIPISKWEDLTNDEEVVETLHEVYGNDVEKLDLLVGLHAEEKIKGFAISETAFFIFLLIASRRLEADRFFTTNFNARTYTEKGLEWVNKSESMKDVINHHYPHITSKWIKSSSAFSVWNSMPDPESKIPLYLRPAP